MARETITLAGICPADLTAETNAITDEQYELFDTFPRHLEHLNRSIAAAVAALLPDELTVVGRSYVDQDTSETVLYWDVLQTLAPGTVKRDWQPLQDADTARLRDAVKWLTVPREVASRIDLPALVGNAVRAAQMDMQADV